MQDEEEMGGKLGLYAHSLTEGRHKGGKLTPFKLGSRDPLSSERGPLQKVPFGSRLMMRKARPVKSTFEGKTLSLESGLPQKGTCQKGTF